MAEEHRSLRAPAALLCVVGLLGGCSLLAPRSAPLPTPATAGSPASEPQVPAPAVPPSPPATPPQRENRLSAATHSLVTQARTLISRGDLDGASSTLDRALRIEPNNPLLWIELGQLRMAERDAHQAEGCARKALALASGDPRTQARAGRLLADALRAQGRNQEVIELERQSFMR